MIRHIMKDGTERDSVEGIVIRKDDFPTLYAIFQKIELKEEAKAEKGVTDVHQGRKGSVRQHGLGVCLQARH